MPGPVTKPISREYRIYLAIWRKAFEQKDQPDKEPIKIQASTFSMAVSMRQGLYRAIRPFRAGLQFDEDLRQASELFVAYLEKGPDPKAPHAVILRPRLALSELEADLARLGLDEEDLLLDSEKLELQDLANLIDPAPSPRSNPFYTREG